MSSVPFFAIPTTFGPTHSQKTPLQNSIQVKAPDSGQYLGSIGIRDGEPDFDPAQYLSGSVSDTKGEMAPGNKTIDVYQINTPQHKQQDPKKIYTIYFTYNEVTKSIDKDKIYVVKD